MSLIILASKTCRHRSQLERQLRQLGADYEVQYVEEHPELVQRYQLQSSPNLLLDGKLVFRRDAERALPTNEELKRLLNQQV